MKKINIETLGERVIEYKDGKPFTIKTEPMVACVTIAEKLNEIIEELQAKNPPTL